MQRSNESSSRKMSLTEVKNNVNKTGQNWKLRRKKIAKFQIRSNQNWNKSDRNQNECKNDFKCYLLGILKTDQIIIVLVL